MIVGEPLQLPFAAVSVWPSTAVPEIVGSAVLAGGIAVTTALWAEVAEADPSLLVAVTTSRIVEPMSAGTSE